MATQNVNSSCPKPMKATSNGAFQHENPLDYALPLLIRQICLVVAFTRTLAYLFKPLRQPRVIAEIIVSFLLSYHDLIVWTLKCINNDLSRTSNA